VRHLLAYDGLELAYADKEVGDTLDGGVRPEEGRQFAYGLKSVGRLAISLRFR
jgi:hypothetical protein